MKVPILEDRATARSDTDIAVPICVDMDRSLVHADLFVEQLIEALRRGMFFKCVRHFFSGRAQLKSFLSQEVPVDAAILPYNDELLVWLKQQHLNGHTLVLATAADRITAERVARHLNLFSQIVASDGINNLKGEKKRQALVSLFGERGFDYVGDNHSDLPVWTSARRPIIVQRNRRLTNKLSRTTRQTPIVFNAPSSAKGLLRAIRPYQWVKNTLIFIPIITANAIVEVSAWQQAAVAFIAFCAAASSVYLLNDILDIEADRRHPRKRHRPFASGVANVPAGVALAFMLVLIAAWAAVSSGILFPIIAYLFVTLLYSAKLKEFPIVDVFVITFFYVVRIYAGGAAIGHSLSMWLLAFSSFFFFSLALIKRVAEISATDPQGQGRSQVARRGYKPEDAALLAVFGVAASFTSSVVLALFVQAEAMAGKLHQPLAYWMAVPLTLFWQCRLWLATKRGYMHDDPIVFAARDWVSHLVVLALAACVLLAQVADLPFVQK